MTYLLLNSPQAIPLSHVHPAGQAVTRLSGQGLILLLLVKELHSLPPWTQPHLPPNQHWWLSHPKLREYVPCPLHVISTGGALAGAKGSAPTLANQRR